MKITIRSASVDSLHGGINAMVSDGYQVLKLGSFFEWRSWRWVRVYFAELEKVSSVLFTWGPVTERPIPMVPEDFENAKAD